MDFSPKGIQFTPLLPGGIHRLELQGLPYRKASLNITIERAGDKMIEFQINGQKQAAAFIGSGRQGSQDILIQI